MAKTFRTKIIPMGDAHWACIRIPFDVERESGSKARIEKTLKLLAAGKKSEN